MGAIMRPVRISKMHPHTFPHARIVGPTSSNFCRIAGRVAVVQNCQETMTLLGRHSTRALTDIATQAGRWLA